MGRFRREVGGYRGRRSMSDILKLIAVGLGVLVLLAVIAFVFGQRFIVYSDEGPRLELPFLQTEEPELPEIKPGGINMIERPGDTSSEDVPPEEPVFVLSAMTLDLAEIRDGTVSASLEAAGANAVVLEMKDAQGKLHWASGQNLAVSAEVNGPEWANETLRQWLQGEVYAVAKVCCFRDNTVPYYRNNLALRATYGNWRDELGLRWMNPASPDTHTYLWELCRELAQLGFDEILLECYAFPEQGNQESMTTQAPAGRTQAAVDFLKGARQAANENGAKLSVRVETGLFGPEGSADGVTVEELIQQVDCLWVDEADVTLGNVLLGDEADERLVCVRTALEANPTMPQAQLTE